MSTLPMMTQTEFDTCEIVADEAGFGAMQTDAGNLPLRRLDVDARIAGLVATTTVQQTYVNNHERPLEATYIFPLPHRGAVVDFKMIVDDRVIDGVLKERGEARREYREAIQAGHRASIVEEERPDVFNMRVGNIAPGEEATIEITIMVPLVYVAGEATFRFPLVVAPRYIPGTPLDGPSVGAGTTPDTDAVPDASRITPPTLLPGFPSPVSLNLRASIDKRQFEIGPIKSSLHAIQTTQNKGRIDITIQPGERLNRDFILRFEVAQDQVSTQLVTIADDKGKEGTFVLTVLPPKPIGERRGRDVVFVLDRSGSMGGWKMVAARRAVGRMIDTLNQGDRFQVLAFDTVVEPCPVAKGMLDANNRNRYRCIEWIAKVDARGGTEIAEPLMQAIDMVNGAYQDRDRFVVLITDGQVGNERQIVNNMKQNLKGNTRVFTVGIDQGVNASFLEELARIGTGRCELVESEDRLDDVMDRLHQTIDTPVVTELSVTFDGGTMIRSTLTPRRSNALFGDAPLVLSGRYSGTKGLTARLSGAFADASLFSKDVSAVTSTDKRLAAAWARAQIRALEDEYDTAQYNPVKRASLEAKMVATSLKFGVLSRFTSYVAVDREDTVDTNMPPHQVVQPVEPPAGWDMMAAIAPPAPEPMSSGASPRRSMPKKLKSERRGIAPSFPEGAAGSAPPIETPKQGVISNVSSAVKEMIAGSVSKFVGGFEDRDDEIVGFALEETADEILAIAPVVREQAPKQDLVQIDQQQATSPEAIQGATLTPAHDVYVLAVFLVELLLGRRLFDIANGEISGQITSFDPAELKQYTTELGAFLTPLINAMQRNPAHRTADAATFVAELNLRASQDVVRTYVASLAPSVSLSGVLDYAATHGVSHEVAGELVAQIAEVMKPAHVAGNVWGLAIETELVIEGSGRVTTAAETDVSGESTNRDTFWR